METVIITTEYIKLQDLLKLHFYFSGGQAKMLITDGYVDVNGEVCLQRGKKIRPGDVVTFRNGEIVSLTVAYADQ